MVPTDDQLNECEDVFSLTPAWGWDPHRDVYARNEEQMVDCDGNIQAPQERAQLILDEVTEDSNMSSAPGVRRGGRLRE